MTYDSPFAALGNSSDTREVERLVVAIVRGFAPQHDLSRIAAAFDLLDQAIDGRLPGYRRLQTLYHDRGHANEVVLCAARLLHGLHLAGQGLDADHLDAALVGALMHDVGYVMTEAEGGGSGAQFTDSHVRRGMEFTRRHLAGLPPAVLEAALKAIEITDHRRPVSRIVFADDRQRMAAFVTATADLVGQMASREYVERLLLLFFELEEADMGDFADAHELLERTVGFYRVTNARLENELGGLSRHLARHFAAAGGAERDFYGESIARNLDYLERLVKLDREKRIEGLKRGGVVERVLEMKGKL